MFQPFLLRIFATEFIGDIIGNVTDIQRVLLTLADTKKRYDVPVGQIRSQSQTYRPE